MSLISAHQNSGESLPAETLKRLKYGDSNFKLFQLMNQTYLSAFDLECHMRFIYIWVAIYRIFKVNIFFFCWNSDKFWSDICDELWPKFSPIKMSKNDFRPCQMVSSFGENFACAYYSHIWSNVILNTNFIPVKLKLSFMVSQMLATDLYEAFNDVGFENKTKLQDLGKRYINCALLSSNKY